MIEDEAFAGIQDIIVSLPAGVTTISTTAFDPSVVLLVPEGSSAEQAAAGLDLKVIPVEIE